MIFVFDYFGVGVVGESGFYCNFGDFIYLFEYVVVFWGYCEFVEGDFVIGFDSFVSFGLELCMVSNEFVVVEVEVN